MKHRATPAFWKRYDLLQTEVQRLADKNFELLKSNPKHPSLHFKNVRGRLWSVRIGLGHRAIALPHDEGFDWVWVGTHEEYDQLLK